MKQYISADQLKELDAVKYKNLIEALETSGAPFEVLEMGGQYLATYISIGLMIELLEAKDQCLNITKRTDLDGWGYEIQLRHIGYWEFGTGKLVDELWKAVKTVL